MTLYAYSALDTKGKVHKGVKEADSPRLLRQSLRSEGLSPVEVDEAEAKQETTEKVESAHFQRQASAPEIAQITRQLATLVAASIPIDECLQALSKQVNKKHLSTMITGIRAKVMEGHTLSDALGYYPKTFDSLYCAMIAAGEKSGHLDSILERLADYTEQKQQIRSKLTQAMIYPMVLAFVMVSVVIALLTTVVPTVVDQFDMAGRNLPEMTQTLIAVSDFVQDHGMKVLGVILALLVVRQRTLKNKNLKLVHDRHSLKLPVFGSVLSGVDIARFSRTLSILISSTVPLVEAMKISAQVMSNTWIRKSLMNASEQVREGSSLWNALDRTNLLSPMMLHIIASGERSGELDDMLLRAANAQDKLFEDQVNIALGILGPFMIVIMAGLVLFIVMAILTPMMDLNSLMG